MSIPFDEKELYKIIGKQNKINEYEFLHDAPFWPRGLKAYSLINRFICEDNHTRRSDIEQENKRMDEITRKTIRNQHGNTQNIEKAVRNRKNKVHLHDAKFSDSIIESINSIKQVISEMNIIGSNRDLQLPPDWKNDSSLKLTSDERNLITEAIHQKEYKEMLVYSYENLGYLERPTDAISKAKHELIKYQNRLLVSMVNDLPDIINLGYLDDDSNLFTLDFKPATEKSKPANKAA